MLSVRTSLIHSLRRFASQRQIVLLLPLFHSAILPFCLFILSHRKGGGPRRDVARPRECRHGGSPVPAPEPGGEADGHSGRNHRQNVSVLFALPNSRSHRHKRSEIPKKNSCRISIQSPSPSSPTPIPILTHSHMLVQHVLFILFVLLVLLVLRPFCPFCPFWCSRSSFWRSP